MRWQGEEGEIKVVADARVLAKITINNINLMASPL
jgi:hypothetical protein